MTQYPYFEDIHRKIQETAKQMSQEFKKTASEADKTKDHEIIKENLHRLGELDLLGIPIPAQYGGVDGDLRTYVLVAEEIARACASTAFALNSQLMCIKGLLLAGNEDQKEKFLPPLMNEHIGAFAATEPEAGSDLASLQTKATLEGDAYILNGEKHYITNGIIADTILLFATTDPSKGPKGISCFILGKDTPGVEMGKVEDKMGVRAAPATQIFLDDARVPKENLLGKKGNGFRLALQILNRGRLGLSAISVGIAKAALKHATTYATQREQFGEPIAKKQSLRFMMADMATQIRAMENLTYHTAWLADHGERIAKEAAMAKLFNSEKALSITNKAIQIHGGAGYTKEYPVERFHRDAKVMTIADGTSEIMRMLIARDLL